MSRRDFLLLAWQAMASLAAAGLGFIGWRFLASRAEQNTFGGIFIAGSLGDFPKGSVTPFPEGQFYVVHLPEGGLLALHRKCTHLNCVVLWNTHQGQFSCPCHGSMFEMDGTLINPPAPRPLNCFPITLENDIIMVDTGKHINREDAVVPTEETL